MASIALPSVEYHISLTVKLEKKQLGVLKKITYVIPIKTLQSKEDKLFRVTPLLRATSAELHVSISVFLFAQLN